MNEIQAQVQYLEPAPGLNPGDLVDLGNDLQAAGIIEGRALVAEMQQMGTQMALNIAPKILERIRKIQEARIRQMLSEIRLLPQYMGHVSRDQVLRIIQNVGTSTPRM